jgi:hypothetical protein
VPETACVYVPMWHRLLGFEPQPQPVGLQTPLTRERTRASGRQVQGAK